MTILTGDCLEVMKTFPDNHFSAIVTDPPYGLKFMNKEWDRGIPIRSYWQSCLRISKPGSHLLAFGGSRTFHRLACEIEDAGYEIRDTIMWIYGSGFPKSHNRFGLGGYGTALKPAFEPAILAMKPLDGTFKENAQKWGLGGINIDKCRIPTNGEVIQCIRERHPSSSGGWDRPYQENSERCKERAAQSNADTNTKGRWPANVIFDEETASMLDEQSGMPIILPDKRVGKSEKNDFAGASRFFYCAKTSPSERNEGLNAFKIKESKEHSFGRYRCKKCSRLKLDHNPCTCEEPEFENIQVNKNNHPTVKPLKLMEYLITLVMPPQNGLLLDPFVGSGSTIVAAQRLGFEAIGIEKEADYADIARARIAAVAKKVDRVQLDLFEGV